MRLCRFDDDRLGLVSLDLTSVADVTSVLDSLTGRLWPRPNGDVLIEQLDRLRPLIEEKAAGAAWKPLSAVAVKSPVSCPGKLIAAPVNYQAHIDEAKIDKGINFGKPILTIEQAGLFLKASSSIVGPYEGIQVPATAERIDHEVELVAVIGKPGRNIPRSEAMSHVCGYGVGLDMTVRGPGDRSWRKSYDSFAVIGPWLVTADEIADPGNLDLSLRVNGEVRQSSNTKRLIFDIPRLIEYASSVYALYPGDVIMTGTPEGVGPVRAGDVLDCYVEQVGSMQVAVHSA